MTDIELYFKDTFVVCKYILSIKSMHEKKCQHNYFLLSSWLLSTTFYIE